MLNRIYHLGYAVEDIEAAARFYRENFGATPGEPEVVEEQGIVATMFRVGESSIELVQPTRPDSPVGKFLAKRGEGFHHVAFEVDDLEGRSRELKRNGVELIDEEPRRGRGDEDRLRPPRGGLRGAHRASRIAARLRRAGGSAMDTEKRRDERRTESGIEVKPLYKPGDLEGFDYPEKLGDPGEYPYTRGPYPTMYRGRPWTMRQYAGFGTARETNARFKYLTENGQTGLSVAFDLPTQMGRDSDHQLSLGEVGKVGVAIDSLLDMRDLFDGIPLVRSRPP